MPWVKESSNFSQDPLSGRKLLAPGERERLATLGIDELMI
jgi:hypothetical protein